MSTAVLMKKLMESSLTYVAISGYDNLLEKKLGTSDRPLSLLAPREVKNSLVTYLQAIPSRNARDNYDYLVSSGNMQEKIRIYEKGRGVFPERFESELILNRVVRGELLHVPDREREFWMTLYVMVVHEGRLDPHHRHVMLEQLRSRTGVIRCNYKGFPYFPDIFVPKLQNVE